jgi:hypothetical protein
MHVYLITYAFWAAIGYLARARKHSLALAAAFGVFLVVFMGTRFMVGCDTGSYAMRYQMKYQGVGWIEAMEEGEGLFNWLNMALIHLGASFNALLMVCALIFVACLYRFATVYRQPLSVMVLSFPVLVLQMGMSGLRQALATGFLMLAYASFVKGRRWSVAAWIVLASQFHTSSIIFLPIALLAGKRVSAVRLMTAMLVLSPVIAWFLGMRLEVYSDRYVEQIYGENSSSGAWFRYVLILIPFLLLEWKRRLVEQRHPELYELLRLFALASFALAVVGLVSSVALHRLVFYVMPVSILALLCVADSIFQRHNRPVAIAIPFLAYGGYILMWFTLSKHSAACYVPYQSWLL